MTEKRAGAGKQAKAKSAGRRILPRVAAPADDLRRAVRDIVPAAFRDGQLQAEKLAQILQVPAEAQAPDRYRFEWAGKQDALRLFAAPPGGTLAPDPRRCRAPDPEKSAGAFASRNVYIEAENLEALKIIARAYAGRVGMIYIDPPYNTGNDFVYNDKFAVGSREYMARAGMLDRRGRASRAARDEVRRLNGHKHSAWLSMMFPRLMVARSLLADDGVIFVSIDDNEVHHLRLVMNEVFGDANYYSTLTYVSKTKPSNMGEARYNIQPNVEYVLAYGIKPMTARSRFNLEEVGEREYPETGKRGPFRREEIMPRRNTGRSRRNTMVYPILGIQPKDGYRWQLPLEQYEELTEKGQIEIIDGKPFMVIYPKDEENEIYAPFWSHLEDVGTSEGGKRELSRLVGHGHDFETVKPLGLLKHLISHATGKDDIVLDFFSGSATTAHAVMELNAVDGGKRRCVSVQFPEPIPEGGTAHKLGFRTIADIGRKRLEQAGAKIRESANGNMFAAEVDIGFRYFRWSEDATDKWPDIRNSEGAEKWNGRMKSHGKLTEKLQPLALLVDAMLRMGYPLCAAIEEKTVQVPVSEEGDKGETTPCRVFHVTTPEKPRGFHFCAEPSIPIRIGRALRMRRDDLLICREDAVDDSTAVTIVRRHRLMVI